MKQFSNSGSIMVTTQGYPRRQYQFLADVPPRKPEGERAAEVEWDTGACCAGAKCDPSGGEWMTTLDEKATDVFEMARSPRLLASTHLEKEARSTGQSSNPLFGLVTEPPYA